MLVGELEFGFELFDWLLCGGYVYVGGEGVCWCGVVLEVVDWFGVVVVYLYFGCYVVGEVEELVVFV